MKRLMYLLTTVLVLTFAAEGVSATTLKADPATTESMTKEQKEIRLQQIAKRVEEIKAMDRSHFGRLQKKSLRHELRAMEKEARAITSGGVYLSVGAILIIILVLIIIL